jgi:hypothetical protein
LHLLDDLVREHGRCLERRLQVDRELARLEGLIRSIVRMLPAEHQARGEQVLDRLEKRPIGLTAMIRLALSNGNWHTPREIRDTLVAGGWFGAYKSDPLPSVHTTLKRLIPETVESRIDAVKGRVYRLRRGEPLARARAGARRLQEIRDAGHDPGAALSS